ncbi:Scarecrow protein 3 [Spatholobus suberectus]|nr:Scarecrow protein 3 [Spatholobus suberectus]
MKGEDRGKYLARILNACAKFIESGSIMNADTGLDYIAHIASPYGDAMQRVATYISEGLACQILKKFHGIPKALSLSKTMSTSEEQLVKKSFFDLYPFLKIAYVITSHAIAEAMEGEEVIHVIDLGASDAAQWIYLMQRLKESQKNHPFLKITGIHENKEILEQVTTHLRVEAEKLNFHLQFNAIVRTMENLDLEELPVKKGEPLAISSVLQLHKLLATDDAMVCSRSSPAESMHQRTFAEMIGKQKTNSSSVSSSLQLPLCATSTKMMHFLNGLWKLQPRVMVITEQESNVNCSSLTERVDKALDFYGALFNCLESTVSTTLVERIIMERTLLGEEIKNIVACEGVERKERHEKLETWIPRLELAGFGKGHISHHGMMQATKRLHGYGNGYKLCQENNCLFVCWNDKPLFSVSVWTV